MEHLCLGEQEICAETELVRRLKQDDAPAMGELYDRFGAMVYAIALRMVREPEHCRGSGAGNLYPDLERD